MEPRGVVRALETTPRSKLPLSMFTTWLARGERGISSEAIVEQLTGERIGHGYHRGDDHPYDPSDLRRCMLLLDQHDLAKLVFPGAMVSRSRSWAALDAVWDELIELLREEMKREDGKAPKTYARMREVLDEARAS